LKPRVIGILGGIAGGKSRVAAMMAARGGVVIDADRIGHETLSDAGVREEIARRFGAGALDESGAVSRAKLGRMVFNDAAALKELNAITHPAILKRIAVEIRELSEHGGAKAIILDAALLIECNLQTMCDALVFVEASEGLRAERARKDRGWNADETARRERFQADAVTKKRLAGHVIVNNGTIEDLESEVDRFWKSFVLLHDENSGGKSDG